METTVHLFLWLSVGGKRRPPNMDNSTKPFQSNYTPLSQNRSKVGRKSTEFVLSFSFPVLSSMSIFRKDSSKPKGKHCRFGPVILRRIWQCTQNLLDAFAT